MKVLAINGSPHSDGCTHTALSFALSVLEQEGIATEILHVGGSRNHVCISCYSCFKSELPRCALGDDTVNPALEKAATADGIILASPVHFASIAGSMKCFLDRFFFVGSRKLLTNKVGMSIACARRAGSTATFDQLNHYLHYSSMPIAASTYWNIIHGMTPDEVRQDKEGIQTIENAARNMAWMIKLQKQSGIAPPQLAAGSRTNFIR